MSPDGTSAPHAAPQKIAMPSMARSKMCPICLRCIGILGKMRPARVGSPTSAWAPAAMSGRDQRHSTHGLQNRGQNQRSIGPSLVSVITRHNFFFSAFIVPTNLRHASAQVRTIQSRSESPWESRRISCVYTKGIFVGSLRNESLHPLPVR